MTVFPYLSAAIWIPILCGVLVLAIGADRNAGLVRGISLVGSVAGFLVTLPLVCGFDRASSALQFVEKHTWIERLGINYHLGVDGLSVWFVVLTAIITVIVVVAAWEVIQDRVAQYMAAFLILSGLLVGVFSAVDGLMFYIF